jgi:hypothetical protein
VAGLISRKQGWKMMMTTRQIASCALGLSRRELAVQDRTAEMMATVRCRWYVARLFLTSLLLARHFIIY